MSPVRFRYAGPRADLVRRRILDLPLAEFHARALARVGAEFGSAGRGDEHVPAAGDSAPGASAARDDGRVPAAGDSAPGVSSARDDGRGPAAGDSAPGASSAHDGGRDPAAGDSARGASSARDDGRGPAAGDSAPGATPARAPSQITRDPAGSREAWELRLGDALLFDEGGLRLLAAAVAGYSGAAERLEIRLVPDPAALRDYYGLHEGRDAEGSVRLPVEAVRGRGAGRAAVLRVTLPASLTPIPYPRSLAEPVDVSAPHALLLEHGCEFDLLFANQIAWPAELRRRAGRDPGALIRGLFRGLFRRHPRDLGLRVAGAWRSIDRTAEIHPTAVIEGSAIGAGARVGAHCTVRFSVIGAGARLHDGAKVEFSTVGAGSWLMHDLVLYRCHVEDEVFLIHGPYQFSSFHSRSAAFATILMDWMPHGGPIRVATPRGLREYCGRFLGSVLREGARTLGGSLLAPGRIVPENTWLGGEPSLIHRRMDGLPAETPVAPATSATARDSVRS